MRTGIQQVSVDHFSHPGVKTNLKKMRTDGYYIVMLERLYKSLYFIWFVEHVRFIALFKVYSDFQSHCSKMHTRDFKLR